VSVFILILISFIILSVFFPEVYAVLDSWLTEKLTLPPLSL
jgi:hypothetical protein